MIRRPPRSTLFPYTDALPISDPAGAANGALAWHDLPLVQDRRAEPGAGHLVGRALDVCDPRRRRADEQCRRACAAPSRHLAQAVLRHPERRGEPFRRADPVGRDDLSSAGTQRLGVPNRGCPRHLGWSTSTLIALGPLNAYTGASWL